MDEHAKPHPKWRPGLSSRHPQSEAEWDYRNDPAGGAFERSRKRLCVAMDYDDPRAPDQMCVVLRTDLIRLMHEWTHKDAAFNAGVRREPMDASGSYSGTGSAYYTGRERS